MSKGIAGGCMKVGLNKQRSCRKGIYRLYLKRPFDVVFSCIALLILWPLLLILAVLIRIKLGSPVIFKQVRPGLKEKNFTLYKFRTMNHARDKHGNLFPDEVRLTRFGKKLRETSLDELPELYNILKGDMSFVGPRPLLVSYIPLYSKRQKHRHDVRPGLTGLAQVSGRNAISWEEKFNYDIAYVRRVTLKRDLCIIIQTVWKVVRRESITNGIEVTTSPFTGSGRQ